MQSSTGVANQLAALLCIHTWAQLLLFLAGKSAVQVSLLAGTALWHDAYVHATCTCQHGLGILFSYLAAKLHCACEQGIFVDEEENVLEGPNINLGIITRDNEMIVRPMSLDIAALSWDAACA